MKERYSGCTWWRYCEFLGKISVARRQEMAKKIIPSNHGVNGIGNSTTSTMSHHKRQPDGSLVSDLFSVPTYYTPSRPFLTRSRNALCTRVSAESSGWKVAAIALPWRTATGSLPSVAITSTPGPIRPILGARMNTISIGDSPSLPSRMELSTWRPYAFRRIPISSAPSPACVGFSTSVLAGWLQRRSRK